MKTMNWLLATLLVLGLSACMEDKQGKDGKDGDAGAQGAPGADGKDGVDGTNGTNGTDGAKGATGATGKTGATGATGATGDAGAPGANGTDGKDGKDGTSVTVVLVCGNGTCDAGETAANCPADCVVVPPAPSCGDHSCNGTETYLTCPADCAAPAPFCGDGTCNNGETHATCAADCPAAPSQVITNVTVSHVGKHAATITWTSSIASGSDISCDGYDDDGGYIVFDFPSTAAVSTSHSVDLAGLEAGYSYDCEIIDGSAAVPTFTASSDPSPFRSTAPYTFSFHKGYIGGSQCAMMVGNVAGASWYEGTTLKSGMSWSNGPVMTTADSYGYLTTTVHLSAGRYCFTYEDMPCAGHTPLAQPFAFYGNLKVSNADNVIAGAINMSPEGREYLFATQYDATNNLCDPKVTNPGVEICADIDAQGNITPVEDWSLTDSDGHFRQNLEGLNLQTTGCN